MSKEELSFLPTRYCYHCLDTMPSYLKRPSALRKDEIIRNFVHDYSSLLVTDNETGRLEPAVCSVCDGIPNHPGWNCWVDVPHFKKLCLFGALDKSRVSEFYPSELVQQYTADHPELKSFVLSPRTKIDKENDRVLVCKSCKTELERLLGENYQLCRRRPPKEAIANGFLVGDAPEELTCLNQVELALVSRARISCQTWIFVGGFHQQIKGWHTIYKNRPSENVGNIQMLQESGLKGSILVVLCGPFTTTQKAMVRDQVTVNPEKVTRAFKWLIEHNYKYENATIPTPEEMTTPIIIEDNV